jgi:hypothetical protein
MVSPERCMTALRHLDVKADGRTAELAGLERVAGIIFSVGHTVIVNIFIPTKAAKVPSAGMDP